VDEHAVSRVIARPFTGMPGSYRRTAHRRDFSIAPVGVTLLDRLADAGIPRVGIGKVDDLFAGRNITSEHTPTNRDAYRLVERALASVETGFIFVNVIEFDQTWGHRNDVEGFHHGLQELDAWIPRLRAGFREDDLVIITADHGSEPQNAPRPHLPSALFANASGRSARRVQRRSLVGPTATTSRSSPNSASSWRHAPHGEAGGSTSVATTMRSNFRAPAATAAPTAIRSAQIVTP